MASIKITHIFLLSIMFGALTVLFACSDQPINAATALNASATTGAGERVESSVQEQRHASEAARNICASCGTVRGITAVTQEGESTGVGAALGAIVGGIAGHQVGGGTGNKIATIAGAIGGAVAGNKVEKKRDTDLMYDVRIEMEDGDEQIIRVPDAISISVGSEVTVEGNQIYLR